MLLVGAEAYEAKIIPTLVGVLIATLRERAAMPFGIATC